jgi:hypothetical protein
LTTEFTVDLDHLDEIVSRLAGLAGFVADNLDEIDNKVATLWERLGKCRRDGIPRCPP